MPVEEGMTCRVMGEAHRLKGEWETAEKYLKDSLAILERLKRRYETGRTLFQLALLYREMGKESEARGYEERARTIFEALGARADLERAKDAFPSCTIEEMLWIQSVPEAKFAAYVKEALENLGWLDRLMENPLLQLWAIDAYLEAKGLESTPLARAKALRHLLIELVEELRGEEGRPCKTRRWYRVLYHTYLQRKESNEAVAERLNLAMSTFYRHLKQGREMVTVQLRERELASPRK